jgi:hypothetical protein
MNFGRNDSLAGAAAAEDGAEDHARFYREFAEGLHAMAQPLTILRGAMAAMTLREEIDLHHYMEMSACQVDRLCDVMASLQHLLLVKQYEPKCSDFDLWDALAPAMEERKRVLGEAGIGLTANGPPQRVWVHGDAERARKALLAALTVMAALAAEGDVIRLSVEAGEDWAEIALENTCRPMGCLSAPDRLCLASAQASMRSQQGSVATMENPSRIVLTLPAVPNIRPAAMAQAKVAERATILTNFSFEAGD